MRAMQSKDRTTRPDTLRKKLLLILPLVAILAACSTSQPASVDGLKGALGGRLPGAQGKTESDQNAIDDTVARGCAIDAYTGAQCRKHTRASAERIKQIREEKK